MEVKDERMDWLSERVVAALKAKPDMFSKLLAAEEGEIIRKFMDDDQKSKLFFTAGAKEMFVFEIPPQNTKKKVFFCMKPEEIKIGVKEIASQIVCGDLPPALLENFWSVLEGVYLPMLSNPKNQHVRATNPNRYYETGRPSAPFARCSSQATGRQVAAGCGHIH